ncbi:unnamed protein product [Cercospora beticola]|nr:unnamed protein product [Cercospora beticola]
MFEAPFSLTSAIALSGSLNGNEGRRLLELEQDQERGVLSPGRFLAYMEPTNGVRRKGHLAHLGDITSCSQPQSPRCDASASFAQSLKLCGVFRTRRCWGGWQLLPSSSDRHERSGESSILRLCL